MDSTSLVMSPVEIKNPNLERYPLFASKLKRIIQCDIGEGDALFLPSFWYVLIFLSDLALKRTYGILIGGMKFKASLIYILVTSQLIIGMHHCGTKSSPVPRAGSSSTSRNIGLYSKNSRRGGV